MLDESVQRAGLDDFVGFVRAHQARLVQLCFALAGDRQLGEDLAQATLHRIWTRWDRVSAATSPWAYTQAVAVSLSRSWWRRRWRHVESVTEAVPEVASLDRVPARVEGDDRVRRWLAALTPGQRAVIVLRFLADLSVEETAQRVGCSTGTVKSQTAKALTRLRAVLEAEGQMGSIR